MADERPERCETCRFYNDLVGDEEADPSADGECRARPPAVFANWQDWKEDCEQREDAAYTESEGKPGEDHIWPKWQSLSSFSERVFPPVFADDWCGEWRGKEPLGPDPALLAKPLTECDFSPRVGNVLASPSYWKSLLHLLDRDYPMPAPRIAPRTLGELSQFSESEIRVVNGVGDKAMAEIRLVLTRYGLKLKGE